jgi:hypothetical protein
MSIRSPTVLAMALVFACGVAAAAQTAGQDARETERYQSAHQNVVESEAYSRLLCANPGFRARRRKIECGPIGDPQLHAQCLDSFQCGSNRPAHHATRSP